MRGATSTFPRGKCARRARGEGPAAVDPGRRVAAVEARAQALEPVPEHADDGLALRGRRRSPDDGVAVLVEERGGPGEAAGRRREARRGLVPRFAALLSSIGGNFLFQIGKL